jgi:cob(I)alamin adenosyltransferase
MDGLNNQLPDLKNFILPNGSKAQTYAHICRTICRRAEIEVLNCLVMENTERVAIITKYLNRLSDFFFVLARYIGHKENIDETIWKND